MELQINWSAAVRMAFVNHDATPVAVRHPKTREYQYGIRTHHDTWLVEPIWEQRELAIADYFESFLGGEENLPTV